MNSSAPHVSHPCADDEETIHARGSHPLRVRHVAAVTYHQLLREQPHQCEIGALGWLLVSDDQQCIGTPERTHRGLGKLQIRAIIILLFGELLLPQVGMVGSEQISTLRISPTNIIKKDQRIGNAAKNT